MAHIAPLIRHHHECWNGGGYPDGLHGDAIPIACRVLAIGDAYEAITGERQHQATYSASEALKEITHMSGTQFDPRLVALFVALRRNGEIGDYTAN